MKWSLHNTGQFSNSSGRRPIKRGRDDTSNTKKMDPVAALLTALQLALDAEANEGKFGNVAQRVDPWEDPVDALAVQQGGSPVFVWAGMEMPRDGRAIILRNSM